MRKEIKHDMHLLTAKLLEAQINLGLEPSFEISWNELLHVLSDDTSVHETKWKELKGQAMDFDYEQSQDFVSSSSRLVNFNLLLD